MSAPKQPDAARTQADLDKAREIAPCCGQIETRGVGPCDDCANLQAAIAAALRAEREPLEREVERLRCGACGKPCSTEVPKGTIVRAWIECPECIGSATTAEPDVYTYKDGTTIPIVRSDDAATE